VSRFTEYIVNNILYVIAGALVITLPGIYWRQIRTRVIAFWVALHNAAVVSDANVKLDKQNTQLRHSMDDATRRADMWQESSESKDGLITDLRTRIEAVSEQCHQILQELSNFEHEVKMKSELLKAQAVDNAAVLLWGQTLEHQVVDAGLTPAMQRPNLTAPVNIMNPEGSL
jgi:hypothetical protein